MTPQGPDLHIFIIRARPEPREIPGAPPEWRFWIEHHPGGARQYFRCLSEVLAFITRHLPAEAIDSGVLSPPR